MKVEFEKKEIVTFLVDYLELDEVKNSLVGLKKIDWNPFDQDEDEYETPWAEIKNNFSIVSDAVSDLVFAAERLVVGGVNLNSSQKHEAVVSALDHAIKLPWYLEPFDGAILGMLVNLAVSAWNTIGWGLEPGEELAGIEIEKADDGFKEIG